MVSSESDLVISTGRADWNPRCFHTSAQTCCCTLFWPFRVHARSVQGLALALGPERRPRPAVLLDRGCCGTDGTALRPEPRRATRTDVSGASGPRTGKEALASER